MAKYNLKRCRDQKVLILDKDLCKNYPDFHYILCCKRGFKIAFVKIEFLANLLTQAKGGEYSDGEKKNFFSHCRKVLYWSPQILDVL